MDGAETPIPLPMTTTDSPSLDATLLQKVRHQPNGKITARCPACAETGGDRTGNHLVIFPDGRFACAAHPGDADHRRSIHRLAGHPPSTTANRRGWDRQAAREQQQREQRMAHLTERARARRGDLVSRHAWHPADVWEDSPQRMDGALTTTCPRHFLASLFPEDALLWAGEVHHSGTAHRTHWRTCNGWHNTTDAIGPMTTPAIWRPGTVSRTASHVLASPYTVLDFDGFDGIKPTTPDELETHLHASLALIRWLRERLHWRLAAILHTAGKSLHAWFRTPPPEVLETLRHAAHPLGIDAGLIGRPEHPCRLPGQVHQGTGGISRVLWLAVPAATAAADFQPDRLLRDRQAGSTPTPCQQGQHPESAESGHRRLRDRIGDGEVVEIQAGVD